MRLTVGFQCLRGPGEASAATMSQTGMASLLRSLLEGTVLGGLGSWVGTPGCPGPRARALSGVSQTRHTGQLEGQVLCFSAEASSTWGHCYPDGGFVQQNQWEGASQSALVEKSLKRWGPGVQVEGRNGSSALHDLKRGDTSRERRGPGWC